MEDAWMASMPRGRPGRTVLQQPLEPKARRKLDPRLASDGPADSRIDPSVFTPGFVCALDAPYSIPPRRVP
ncbi:hypothetical protein BO71DRAFT_400082 [Aspergillus ellipticus CBS 707.79]|uniref:Uncharacterized protein n=1 Tax=Aspergillus ellipticus CBS 707.79 TaxID=1448320 RepID=A0A319D741_9EURO|nr:hypothetical protein BO71DRAFT_400082 [Aspergillus ellipticus CBS 707.79]